MSASPFRRKIIAVVAAGLMSVLPAGPALADTSSSGAYGTTFVDGAGDLGDDFGDHYVSPVSQAHVDQGQIMAIGAC